MTDKLRTLMESQRRLLHDVSHELRSPIARLQASIGLARLQPDKTAITIERIERESVRMDKLVGELLTLSRLEAGVTGAMEDEIRMDDLLTDIIDDARFEAEANHRHVDGKATSQTVIYGGAELLYPRHRKRGAQRCQTNHAGQHRRHQYQSGSDLGPAAHRRAGPWPGRTGRRTGFDFRTVFPQQQNQKNSNGYGLGLTIARRIIEAHNGQIRAGNRIDGGLCVDITLPCELLAGGTSSGFRNGTWS